MDQQKPKTGRGCLFWGGITAGVLFLIVLLAVLSGVRLFKKYVNEYTDAAPLALPAVQATDEQVNRIRERVKTFEEAVRSGKSVQPLIVTADEANALIAKDSELKTMQGHFHVTFEEGQVKAQLSIPIERISNLRMLRGRYLNGTGIFTVALRDGVLWVTPQSVETEKGKPLPEDLMKSMRTANFAEAYTKKLIPQPIKVEFV